MMRMNRPREERSDAAIQWPAGARRLLDCFAALAMTIAVRPLMRLVGNEWFKPRSFPNESVRSDLKPG